MRLSGMLKTRGAAVLCLFIFFSSQGFCLSSDIYEKKDNWQQTMLAVRSNYSSALKKGAVEQVWKQVQKDFPFMSARMLWDTGEKDVIKWLEATDSVEIEKRMIGHLIDELDDLGRVISLEYTKLVEKNTYSSDPKWFDLYVKGCAIRSANINLDKVNIEALKLAVNDLSEKFGNKYPDSDSFLQQAEVFERQKQQVLKKLKSATEQAIKKANKFAEQLIAFQQKALLANPLLDFNELILIKRKPSENPYLFSTSEKSIGRHLGLPQQSSWQLHTMDNIFDWDNEICILSPIAPGGRLKTVYAPDNTELVTDMDLDFDADKLMFSKPLKNRMWQLFEIDMRTMELNQITGTQSDVHSIDGCYLPNGKIAYVSTACFQGVPCNAGVNVGMIYLMNRDGTNIRQLCFEQDHNFCPTVTNDGRLMYLRWEYIDIPHVWARFLFTMNPDGTGQRAFYGSGGYWPNGIYYAKPIPGHPTKVAGIVTGHHVGRIGELYIFDPAKARASDRGVVQQIPGRNKKVKPLIKDMLTSDVWPKFVHPYPLSEDYIIVACRPTPEDMWGIYLVDTFDNMVLIKEAQDYALLEPIPFRKTAKPPVIPNMVIPGKDAMFYVQDIYSGPGLKGVPRGTVKKLRVLTFHFAYRTVAGINHRVGADGPWEPKRIIGTVDVEHDGSVFFTAPANMPLAVQPLDADGKAVQLMRSWMTAMPGEIVSCVGCHENLNMATPNKRTIAVSKPPQDIKQWYGPPRGLSFKRDVQPVLDKYCISCHNSDSPKDVPDLRADQGKYVVYKNGIPEKTVIAADNTDKLLAEYGGVFQPSYIELRSRIRVGGLESDLNLLPPGEFHADNMEFMQMLNKGHYGVKLDAEAVERLAAWIDFNGQCHGTWQEVVGTRKIEKDYKRRAQLREKYACIVEDPETKIDSVAKKPTPVIPAPVKVPADRTEGITNWPMTPEYAGSLQHKTSNGLTETVIRTDNGLRIEMVYIPAGKFIIGDPLGHIDEKPRCVVDIDRPFWISKYEITNDQFSRFDPAHDSRFENKGSWQFNEWDIGWNLNAPAQPVVRISQLQVSQFCKWLTAKTGAMVQLPTEAQWEYACRAGTDTPFYYGDLDTDFTSYANMADWTIRDLVYDVRNQYPPDLVPRDSRFNDNFLVTSKVGTFSPNTWGLYDMHGNVWEWTRTAYKPYPYQENDGRNTIGPTTKVVVRGGSWYDRPKRCRSGYRLYYPAWRKVYNVGFRIVVPLSSMK